MTILGLWLMIAPDAMGYEKNIANNAHIVGPLIATFSMIAIWECTRNVRLLNLPIVVWMLAAPLFISYENDTALLHDYGVAIAVMFLCFVKPVRKYRFGGGWPAVWRDGTPHSRLSGNPRRAVR
jgi:hypothetical protein